MDRTLFITLLGVALTLLFLYLLITILAPFLAVLVWSGAIGIITYPLYTRLLTYCRSNEILAATLLTTAVVLAVIGPLVGLLFTLSQEAAQAYYYLEKISGSSELMAPAEVLNHPWLAPMMTRLRPLINSLHLEVDAMILPVLKNGLAGMLNYSTSIVKNFLGFLFKLGLMLITLFFIYKDGNRFLKRFWQVIAISESLRSAIVTTVTRVLEAVMYGVMLTCLVQGILGGIGFLVAGLPSPLLFGALMTICSPIPFIGTALIWLPGAVYLLMHGKIFTGLMLIVWGVLLVSGIDNVIRPLFISGRAKLPILVIVFGLLGGFLSFGAAGLVIGPVALALVLVFLDAYRESAHPADIS